MMALRLLRADWKAAYQLWAWLLERIPGDAPDEERVEMRVLASAIVEVKRMQAERDAYARNVRRARIEELNPFKDRLREAGCTRQAFGAMIEEIIDQRDEYRCQRDMHRTAADECEAKFKAMEVQSS